MINNLSLLCYIVGRLEQAGMDCIVFGGWANELTGAIAARPHKDIDLLYFSDDFEKLDAFIHNQWDIEEIRAKHFPHKRAFICGGVMTEIILLSHKKDRLITNFWNDFEFEWPDMSTIRINIQGRQLFVSAPWIVEYYHRNEKEIAHVRERHTHGPTPQPGSQLLAQSEYKAESKGDFIR